MKLLYLYKLRDKTLKMNLMTIAIIWMITNLIIGVGFFLTAVIPGINFVGVPIILAISAVVNTVFIVWMMIRFMQKMNKQGFKNYASGNQQERRHSTGGAQMNARRILKMLS